MTDEQRVEALARELRAQFITGNLIGGEWDGYKLQARFVLSRPLPPEVEAVIEAARAVERESRYLKGENRFAPVKAGAAVIIDRLCAAIAALDRVAGERGAPNGQP